MANHPGKNAIVFFLQHAQMVQKEERESVCLFLNLWSLILWFGFALLVKHHRANRRFYVLSPRLETLTCGLHPVKLNIYRDEVMHDSNSPRVCVLCVHFCLVAVFPSQPFLHT